MTEFQKLELQKGKLKSNTFAVMKTNEAPPNFGWKRLSGPKRWQSSSTKQTLPWSKTTSRWSQEVLARVRSLRRFKVMGKVHWDQSLHAWSLCDVSGRLEVYWIQKWPIQDARYNRWGFEDISRLPTGSFWKSHVLQKAESSSSIEKLLDRIRLSEKRKDMFGSFKPGVLSWSFKLHRPSEL